MNRRIARVAALAVAALALAGPAAAQSTPAPATRVSSVPPKTGTRWIVDLVHSQVEFRVRHLLGRVRGSFTRWYGVIATQSEDWTHGTVNVQVQTASINTGNGYRDADSGLPAGTRPQRHEEARRVPSSPSRFSLLAWQRTLAEIAISTST